MIRRIAVGYDGSPGSLAAARWSFALAQQLGCSVQLVHAVGLLGRSAKNRDVGDLQELTAILANESGLDRDRARWQVSQGDPCSALLNAAEPPISAELVVVGSRGHRGDVGLPLGNTSHELTEHSSAPVLIIPVVASEAHNQRSN